jgi:hypothetical protein
MEIGEWIEIKEKGGWVRSEDEQIDKYEREQADKYEGKQAHKYEGEQ